jgi:quercetin dioxygenase-like cupin family protein
MVDKPYIDEKLNNWIFVRTFENGRFIEVLEGSGWEFQFDDRLPRKLHKGDRFFIPAKTFHRIKRGNTDLKIKIEEF